MGTADERAVAIDAAPVINQEWTAILEGSLVLVLTLLLLDCRYILVNNRSLPGLQTQRTMQNIGKLELRKGVLPFFTAARASFLAKDKRLGLLKVFRNPVVNKVEICSI